MGITDWLLKPLGWFFARHPDWRDAFGRLLMRLGNGYYWGLAFAFALAGAWNLLGRPLDNQLSHQSFDVLMQQRPIAYQPDPSIVILDIDEPSLAAMNSQYGRWPWPRQVLAEVGQKLEAAGARAVIFDILFADEDIVNRASEAQFDRYVAASHVSFFTALRLNPLNDKDSGLTLSLLKFPTPDPTAPARTVDGQRTVAMIMPYFNSIYEGARVGTVDLTPDADNVVRWHRSYEAIAGYRIPSLPYRVAQVLGWRLPEHAHNLINWPKGVTPYRTIGFAQVIDAARKEDADFFQQFSGKLVLVGSTAPILNDLKATPISPQYPGIYLLATSLDNTKNHRFLQPLSPLKIWILELLMLAAAALLFAHTDQALTVAKYFFIIPAVLFAASLLSVSVSDTLVDLSVPAAMVLGYFTFAKLFDTNIRGFVAGTGPYAATPQESSGQLQIACLAPHVPRAQVLKLLVQPGSTYKLWEPDPQGLGRRWNEQGWVLWRWRTQGTEPDEKTAISSDEAALPLCWVDAPAVAGAGSAFSLAESIAAASRETRETPC
jgi:CHASE2 domain-containing sensor protein